MEKTVKVEVSILVDGGQYFIDFSKEVNKMEYVGTGLPVTKDHAEMVSRVLEVEIQDVTE